MEEKRKKKLAEVNRPLILTPKKKRVRREYGEWEEEQKRMTDAKQGGSQKAKSRSSSGIKGDAFAMSVLTKMYLFGNVRMKPSEDDIATSRDAETTTRRDAETTESCKTDEGSRRMRGREQQTSEQQICQETKDQHQYTDTAR